MKILKNIFDIRKNIHVSVLSLIYSLLILFGNSYMKIGNASLVFNNYIISLLTLVGLFILARGIILLIFKFIDSYKIDENKKANRLISFFDRHPFIVSIIVILMLWLPYIISFYPIILSPDPSYQIKQYFGIPNKYSNYSVLIDPSVIITNHHPVLHTLLLGSCLKLGNIIGNDNFGLFIYSLIQILILSSVLSFTISYMKKIKISYIYRIVVLSIYGLVPMFAFYAISAVKDTIFSSLIVLYTILVYHLIKNRNITLKLKHLIGIILLLIFIILFRNNGFYIVLLSFPFVVLTNKKNLKKLLIVFILFFAFNYSYNKIILPSFKITSGSIREVLSIPFQQTARYVKYNDLDPKEYEIYDKVLDMSDLAKRYKPEISDPVKNKFNKYTTIDDLKIYFKYWLKDLSKDPVVYMDATINNVYGYFYPLKLNWYIYHDFDKRIVKDGFDYHYNKLSSSRKLLIDYGVNFPFIPVVGLISNIGFNTWILFLLTTYLISKKKYRGIIFLLPSFIVLLVCVASPVNTYFRYAMPYIFSMPVIIALFIDYIKRSELDEKK